MMQPPPPPQLTIGVVGNGFVGKAMRQLHGERIRVLAHDRNPAACEPPQTTLHDVSQADLIFVSVPTPMDHTGDVHVGIVEDVVRELQRLAPPHAFVVVRSTVPPGTCRRLGVYFMPEFLTEAHAARDFRSTATWICGLPQGADPARHAAFRDAMQRLLDAARAQGSLESSRLVCVDSSEAEMIKYFRNTFLATKVSFCNELAALCEPLGLDYEAVRRLAADDARIGHSHTHVPGPDLRRGFGGTCFPKDAHGLRALFQKQGVPCPVLSSVLARNEEIDRPGRDWMSDKGRATL